MEKDPQQAIAEAEKETKDRKKNPGLFSVIWETVRYIIIAAIIIIPIRTFVAQPFVVSGNSMYPTFANGEYLIVNELAKYTDEYRRGDVVILRYPNDPSKYFIKRVIGLPGETVRMVDGEVWINGQKLREPYIVPEYRDQQSHSPMVVPSGEFYVLGDRRNSSNDSRAWGTVAQKYIYGKAVFVYWPVDRLGFLP